MTLKVNDKKKIFWRNCIQTISDNEKIRITGIILWIKDPDPDPVFFRIRIRVAQKDRIRPDPYPDPHHW